MLHLIIVYGIMCIIKQMTTLHDLYEYNYKIPMLKLYLQ